MSDSACGVSSEAEAIEDAADVFETSIENLFGQHQSASGSAGQLCTFSLSWTPDNCLNVVKFRIPPDDVNKLQAHYQWDAGAFAARLLYFNSRDHQEHLATSLTLHRQEADVQNKSVLELGAGTGLPGIISAKQGANPVVITDYPNKGIIDCIKENVERITSSQASHVQVQGLDFSDKASVALLKSVYPIGFSRILCADVLWLSSLHRSLVDTIKTLLVRQVDARALVVSGFHTGRRALTRFFSLALQEGLLADEEDVFEFNVVTAETRPWSGSWTFPRCQGWSPDLNVFDSMDDFSERTRWLLYVALRWNCNIV